jgi:hypothetical protein
MTEPLMTKNSNEHKLTVKNKLTRNLWYQNGHLKIYSMPILDYVYLLAQIFNDFFG